MKRGVGKQRRSGDAAFSRGVRSATARSSGMNAKVRDAFRSTQIRSDAGRRKSPAVTLAGSKVNLLAKRSRGWNWVWKLPRLSLNPGRRHRVWPSRECLHMPVQTSPFLQSLVLDHISTRIYINSLHPPCGINVDSVLESWWSLKTLF